MFGGGAVEPTGCFSFDELWDRVSNEDLGHDGWDSVTTSPDSEFRLWLREESPGFLQLRTEYELPAAIDLVVNTLRPEVIFHAQRAKFSQFLAECCVERLISPGDGHGMVRFSDANVEVKRSAVLFGNSEECQRVIRENGSSSLFGIRRLRVAVRRDFPGPGQSVIAMVPCDPETCELREEYGMQRATTGLFEATGPEQTKVTEIKRLPAGSAWALSQSFADNNSLVEACFRQLYKRGTSFVASPEGRELIETQGGYVVITLRKCSHGPPMLPQVVSGDSCSDVCQHGLHLSWVQAEKYELPGYLDTFLSELGVAVDVFEQLDGRQLIHYQAALRLADWERARAALEVPWRVMKAAYRRQLGGSWAPELTPGKAPRFVAWKRWPDEARAQKPRPLVPESKTFVHFSDHHVAPGSRTRSGSTSRLETQHNGVD